MATRPVTDPTDDAGQHHIAEIAIDVDRGAIRGRDQGHHRGSGMPRRQSMADRLSRSHVAARVDDRDIGSGTMTVGVGG